MKPIITEKAVMLIESKNVLIFETNLKIKRIKSKGN